MPETEPKAKLFHGVPVHRSIVAAISEETGASIQEILRELAAIFTPIVFKAIRDKLMPKPVKGALEKALGEPTHLLPGEKIDFRQTKTDPR